MLSAVEPATNLRNGNCACKEPFNWRLTLSYIEEWTAQASYNIWRNLAQNNLGEPFLQPSYTLPPTQSPQLTSFWGRHGNGWFPSPKDTDGILSGGWPSLSGDKWTHRKGRWLSRKVILKITKGDTDHPMEGGWCNRSVVYLGRWGLLCGVLLEWLSGYSKEATRAAWAKFQHTVYALQFCVTPGTSMFCGRRIMLCRLVSQPPQLLSSRSFFMGSTVLKYHIRSGKPMSAPSAI